MLMRTFWMIVCLVAFICSNLAVAGEAQAIKLKDPDKKRGLPYMEALSVKASVREWSEKDLGLQDLSDLLWAACGVNRPSEKKYTNSTAMNAHEVDVYLFMKDGVFLYDAEAHQLKPVVGGDHRSEILMPSPQSQKGAASTAPPIQIVLVGDCARFRAGSEELRTEWVAIDAGIVSENIALFCAATGLKTCPRAFMDREKVRALLHLKESQRVLLNHPIGYAKGS
jgi:SagB-type dehydrogenase family enzyme